MAGGRGRGSGKGSQEQRGLEGRNAELEKMLVESEQKVEVAETASAAAEAFGNPSVTSLGAEVSTLKSLIEEDVEVV